MLADAVISGASGLLMVFGAGFLASLLGLPEALLLYAGVSLLPFAVFVSYASTREHLNRAAIWAVMIANALWAAASVALLLSGWITPNFLGTAFIIFQALVVAVFTEIQYLGVRRSNTAVA
jgi:hypothetical protein